MAKPQLHFGSVVLICFLVTIIVPGQIKKVFIELAFEKRDTVLVFSDPQYRS